MLVNLKVFLFLFIFKIFIYLFWLCWVLVVARGTFLVACLAAACGLLSCSMHVGSSFSTRDRTWAPCIGSMESHPLDHEGSPGLSIFIGKLSSFTFIGMIDIFCLIFFGYVTSCLILSDVSLCLGRFVYFLSFKRMLPFNILIPLFWIPSIFYFAQS